MMLINTLQPIYTAKVLIDQIVARKQRSAIVVTSSGMGDRPIAGNTTYSATKSFASFLARGLSYELSGKVDCLDWCCGMTSTNMVRRSVGGEIVSVTTAVKGMFSSLGKQRTTWGCLNHDLLM